MSAKEVQSLADRFAHALGSGKTAEAESLLAQIEAWCEKRRRMVEALKGPAKVTTPEDLMGVNSVVRGAAAPPRIVAQNVAEDGHGGFTVVAPSGQRMLLDGPEPTPKQVAYIKKQALEHAEARIREVARNDHHLQMADVVNYMTPADLT